MLQKSVMSVVSCTRRCSGCTPGDLPLVCSSADQAKGAPPCKVDVWNTYLFCCIVTYLMLFMFFKVF
jgi:hypothetical protein